MHRALLVLGKVCGRTYGHTILGTVVTAVRLHAGLVGVDVDVDVACYVVIVIT